MDNDEKLDLILCNMQIIKEDIQVMKGDIQDLKEEMQEVKGEVQNLKEEMQVLRQRAASIELHIENTTDNGIQLIAENFVELINKLNEAIPVADKNLAYEVKVHYLMSEIDKIKKEVAGIKSKIA